MYQNIYYEKENNIIHLWDDIKGYSNFSFKKYGYKKTANGKFTALDGSYVEKITKWNKDEEGLYESDVYPDMRTLIDLYGDTDDASVGHRIMFFDIELLKDSEGRYSEVNEALNTINSIAFYFEGKYTMLLLDETCVKMSKEETSKGLLVRCPTEAELLMLFIHLFSNKIKPTIIVGWNSERFDVPMLINRITNVLGESYAKQLSPIQIIEKDKREEMYKIAGVTSFDYMELYKRYTYNEEPSYALDFIAKKELGYGKVEYLGSLDTLYREDVEKFIEYNITDVSLLVDLDAKLRFIDLARSIAHKGHIPYQDVYVSIKIEDGACLTLLKRMDIVAPNKKKYAKETDITDEDDDEEGFIGAFVKEPIPGRYEWVFDVDASGLYPSSQRTLNISPETKIGKILDFDFDKWKHVPDYKFTYKSKKYTKQEFKQFLIDKNYSIAPNGVMFDLNRKGLIPTILEKWGAERDEFRAIAKKYKTEGNMVMANLFDSRQHSLKIIANTLYGVLGNKGFRFYDLDNAEATTLTGQHVTRHSMIKGNEWFNATNDTKDVDYVIYSDTDSDFFSATSIIKKLEFAKNVKLTYEQKAKVTFITSQKVETYINDSFDSFALEHFNVKTHYWKFKQEYVAESAIWISKKRYAQKIISEKGVLISDMTKGKELFKLDVKGLDVVRSNFPKRFRSYMSDMLLKLLNGSEKAEIDVIINEFRDYILTIDDVTEIMPVSTIKNYEKWALVDDVTNLVSPALKTPVHVKSAQNFNNFLILKDIRSQKIVTTNKVKWAYVTQNNFGFETIAIPVENIPKEVMDFLNSNVNAKLIYDKILTKKLEAYYSAMGWGDIPKNTQAYSLFSF